MHKLKLFIIITALILSLARTTTVSGEDVKAILSRISTPTDLDGQLKEKTAFYVYKFKYKDNFFQVNLPESSFKKLTEAQKERVIDYLIEVYKEAFTKTAGIFGHAPEGYKFNITFAKTKLGIPFNRLNLTDRISNVYSNFLPYKNGRDVLTDHEREAMLHEIGHGLFGIFVGTLRHPKTKAIEEGFVDYLAGREFGEERWTYRLEISEAQAKRMRGLTQQDIDRSVWGDEIAIRPSTFKGYAGITHHIFGIEFIDTFIDIFGKEKLSEFLIRLKATEDISSIDDYGTKQTKDILMKIGFTAEDIRKFENELHRRLKKNVFKITTLGPT